MTQDQKDLEEAKKRVNKERGDSKQDILERDNKEVDHYIEYAKGRERS